MNLPSLPFRRLLATSASTALLLGAAGGVLAAPASAETPSPTPTCDETSCTATYDVTGDLQNFTAPAGVAAVNVSVSGASGGSGIYGDNAGGQGATVSGTLPVDAGAQYSVLVGQAGSPSGPATYGGGGAANRQYMGAGGGGSFIFDSSGQVLVAAGGGGGSGPATGVTGGYGAGLNSQGGSGGIYYSEDANATGATSTAAGIGGSAPYGGSTPGGDGTGPAVNFAAGQGGVGGASPYDSTYWGGGGGGGGYYGGGAGAYAQGGAGGSGYADPSLMDAASQDGAHAGDGVVTVNWAVTPQSVTFDPTINPTQVAGTHLAPTVTGGASAEPVVLSIDSSTTNSSCSLSDANTISFDHAGQCVIDADQASDLALYGVAPTAQQTFTVVQSPTNVNLSVSPEVDYGQSIIATAVVTDSTSQTPGQGSVQFYLDGEELGDPMALDSSGSVPSPTLLSGGAVPVGQHIVTANFIPADNTVENPSQGQASFVVNQAATTTNVHVTATSITAQVAPADATGTVTFSVSGNTVGTAPLVSGAAVLNHVVPSGQAQTVSAVYSGDDNYTGSSASTSRHDPVITAAVSSSVAKNKANWYRTPVTVTFHCTANGAPLVAACPAPITFGSGTAQSVTRTITASDGGAATVAVRGINIDRAAPTIKVVGVVNGGKYGTAPAISCKAKDALSGVASCTITRTQSGATTTYTVKATDRAGNTATVIGHYLTINPYVKSAAYSNGVFALPVGHTYTLVMTGQSARPVYYNAAVAPATPKVKGMAFTSVGHSTWTTKFTVTSAMAKHPYWNLGVKVGRTMHVVKIHITH